MRLSLRYALALLSLLLPVAAGAQSLPAPKFNGVTLPTIPTLDLTYAGTPNPNAIMFRPGNMVSFCPLLSCVNGPPNGTVNSAYFGKQRASLLLSATTQTDGEAEEQTLATITTVATGRQKPRTASTAYALGDNATNGNATYRVTTAGTTSSSTTNPLPTTRPTSLPFTVTDGTVVWTWINDGRINGKLGHYNEVAALAGAGTTWAGVDNLELRSGVVPSFHVGREIDLTNNSGSDCAISVANCYGLSIFLQGANRSTAFVDLSSANTANYAAAYGFLFGGAKAVEESVFSIQASSKVGIDFGSFGSVAYSTATIQDASTSPIGYRNLGTHSTAGYYDGSVSGTAVSLNGSYTAAITTNTATTGYSVVAGAGQKLCLNVFDNCLRYASGWQFSKGSSDVVTVSDTGNITAAGTLTGANVSTGGNVSANGALSGASLSVGGLSVGVGAWTSYTPTITTDAGTLSGASATGFYQAIGKTIFYRVRITTGSTISGSGSLNFSLPAGVSSKGGAAMLATDPFGAFYGAKIRPTDNKGMIYNLTSLAYPVTAASMTFDVAGVFEAP